MGIIERLDGYLNLEFKNKDDIQKYTTVVIQKICQSLQNNSIIFIEINKWNYLQSHKDSLTWFLQDFWCSLIQESQIIIQKRELRYVKLVAVIDSESKLKPECKNLPFYCTKNNFNANKILKLSLRKWKEKDIKNWLEIYTNLPDWKINEIVKQVYLKTNKGVPSLVCNALKEELLNARYR